ncbi:collagen-like protein [Zobellia sp.]|nr:collagen-like protein [Zobellia sp.]
MYTGIAQVKIGDDVSTIHEASLLELQSTSKAFVLTRVTTTQMANITPLNGALVYNTDTNCVHAFNGTTWQNLCNTNAGSVSVVDNENGSFTITASDGSTYTSPDFADLKGETGLQGPAGVDGQIGLQGPSGEDGEMGPQGPAGEDGTEIQQEQIVILASNGQTHFQTPALITDEEKIEVFRNGIRVDCTAVNQNTIALESGVICYQNDNIRIVQQVESFEIAVPQ